LKSIIGDRLSELLSALRLDEDHIAYLAAQAFQVKIIFVF